MSFLNHPINKSPYAVNPLSSTKISVRYIFCNIATLILLSSFALVEPCFGRSFVEDPGWFAYIVFLYNFLETGANLRSPTAWVPHALREALQVFQVYFQDMRDNLRHVMQYKCLASTTSSYVFALFWPWGMHAHSNISKHGMCLEIQQRTQLVGRQENIGQDIDRASFCSGIVERKELKGA